jgi:hypothetical protein
MYTVTVIYLQNLSFFYFIKSLSNSLKSVKFSFDINRVEETVASYISLSDIYH